MVLTILDLMLHLCPLSGYGGNSIVLMQKMLNRYVLRGCLSILISSPPPIKGRFVFKASLNSSRETVSSLRFSWSKVLVVRHVSPRVWLRHGASKVD